LTLRGVRRCTDGRGCHSRINRYHTQIVGRLFFEEYGETIICMFAPMPSTRPRFPDGHPPGKRSARPSRFGIAKGQEARKLTASLLQAATILW
jgi:hypothetical protein